MFQCQTWGQTKEKPAVIYGSHLIRGTTVIRERMQTTVGAGSHLDHVIIIHARFKCCSLQVRSKQTGQRDRLAQTDY